MLNSNKTLDQLKTEWENCTGCELGRKRKEVEGKFVFGEGTRRAVMFIGEGPGKEEELAGSPFIGTSGQILRDTITQIGLSDFYITNTVCCRSCIQEYNGEGKPVFIFDRRTGASYPKIKDAPPTQPQLTACLNRLLEQIFLVDPIVIVTLGGVATKVLCNERSTAVTSTRGKIRQIGIPGASFVPLVTGKGNWMKKTKYGVSLPVIQNEIGYAVLPTLHPAYVLRKWADKSVGNPAYLFKKDLTFAMNIYHRTLKEGIDVDPAERELSTADLLNEGYGEIA